MKRKIALISQHVSLLAQPREKGSRTGNIDVARVACQLAWMGIEVEVFTSETTGELPEICEWREKVCIIHVPAALDASQTDRLHAFREYMQDFFSRATYTPDLIHATSWQSAWVAAELKTDLGIPFVVSYDRPTGMISEGSLELDQRVIRLADGIIVNSALEKDDLLSGYDADPTYIVEIPPDEMYDGQSDDAWQSIGRRLAQLYEDVLAVRRVAIPAMRIPVLTAGLYEYQNGLQVMPQAFEPALQTEPVPTTLQSPAQYFYNEAGMLNLPVELTE